LDVAVLGGKGGHDFPQFIRLALEIDRVVQVNESRKKQGNDLDIIKLRFAFLVLHEKVHVNEEGDNQESDDGLENHKLPLLSHNWFESIGISAQ